MEFKNKIKQEFDKIESTDAQKAELTHRVKTTLHRENGKAKQAPRKGKKLWVRLTAVSSACVLVIGAIIGGFFLLRGDGTTTRTASYANLMLDNEKGAAALSRALSAQYLPELEKLTKSNVAQSNASLETATQSKVQTAASTDTVPDFLQSYNKKVEIDAIDLEGFIYIQESLATINISGAGEYYDIYKLRNEVSFILETIPAFNQWFTMPGMGVDKGFVTRPYYESWSYYLESDSLGKVVTITRISHTHNTQAWDFANNKSIKNPDYGEGFMNMRQVMQIKYYFDENDIEVFEVMAYDVARINNDFIPVAIHYLKNVKDTSLTKYDIQFSENKVITENYYPVDWGMDYRNIYPNGTTLSFIQLNYTDADDIKLLKIQQTLPVADIFDDCVRTSVMFYSKDGDDVQLYASGHDYINIDTIVVGEYANMFNGLYVDYCLGAAMTSYFPWSHWWSNDIKTAGLFLGGLGGRKTWETFSNVEYSDNVTRALHVYKTNDEADLMNKFFANIKSLAKATDVPNADVNGFMSEASGITTVVTSNFDTETLLDGLISKMAENAVSNFTLKNNWEQIYDSLDDDIDVYKYAFKEVFDRKGNLIKRTPVLDENGNQVYEIIKVKGPFVIENLYGPFYGKDLPISDLRGRAYLKYYPDKAVLEFNGDARINDHKSGVQGTLKAGGQYSLALALKSETGEIVVLEDNFEYQKGSSSFINLNWKEYDLANLSIDKAGTYTLIWVLVEKQGDQYAVVFDTETIVDVFAVPVTLTQGYTMTIKSRVMTITVN